MPTQSSVTVHCLLQSQLGWPSWRETEGRLYRWLETEFKTLKCELSMLSPNEISLEFELVKPLDDKFTKMWKDKSFGTAIDRIHGIEPLTGRSNDVKLKKFTITGGSGMQMPDSIEAHEPTHSAQHLLNRITNLTTAQSRTQRELDAINEQLQAQIQLFSDRLDKCEGKLEGIVHVGTQRLELLQTKTQRLLSFELSC